MEALLTDLKQLSTARDKSLQINTRIGGGLTVEGFRSLSAAKLGAVCRLHGKKFNVIYGESTKHLKLYFSTIPDFFERSVATPIASQPVHSNSELEPLIERILVYTKGTLEKRHTSHSTVLLVLNAPSIDSDIARALLSIHEVLDVVLLPTVVHVTLFTRSDSRTSLCFLKEHKPQLFSSANKPAKYSALKSSTGSGKHRRWQKKRRGLARLFW
jgi:hypothetical protein